MKRALFVALPLLYLLHDDWWWRAEGRLVLGLPISLLYQLLYCLAASGWLALAVRHLWPAVDGEEVDP